MRWPNPLAKRIAKGDDKAIVSNLRIMEHRAKLMGLYAPTLFKHGGDYGQPIEVKMSNEDLNNAIQQLVSMPGVIAAPRTLLALPKPA